MADHTKAIIREQEAEITRLTAVRNELRELLAEAYAMPEMTASQRRRLDRDQEIAGLEAERDYLTKQLLTIRAHAGDATEYVLAQINKELVEERDHLITERDELRALLEDMKAAIASCLP